MMDDDEFVSNTILDIFNSIEKRHGAYTSGEALLAAERIGVSLLLSVYRSARQDIREELKILILKEINDFSMTDKPG